MFLVHALRARPPGCPKNLLFAAGSLRLRIDVLGCHEELFPLTSQQPPSNAYLEGTWSFHYVGEFSCAKETGAELREAIAAAFESSNPADAEVHIVVQSLAKPGAPSSSSSTDGWTDIGRCHVSLERVLNESSNIIMQPMPIVDTSGMNVGTLTGSVIALEALKAIDDEAEELIKIASNAATKVQSRARGIFGRRSIPKVKEEKAKAKLNAEQRKAATRVQSIHRGKSGRRGATERREARAAAQRAARQLEVARRRDQQEGVHQVV